MSLLKKSVLIFVISLVLLSITSVNAADIFRNDLMYWLSAGYCVISNGALKTDNIGNIAFGGGVGYDQRFGNFRLQTGCEITLYRSRSDIPDTAIALKMADMSGNAFNAFFNNKKITETQSFVNIGVPFTLAYEFTRGFYAGVGAKVLMNLNSQNKTSAYLTTNTNYNELIGNINNSYVSNVDLNNYNVVSEKSFRLNLLYIGTAEIGYTFGKTSREQSMRTSWSRLSVYFDYGYIPIPKNLKSGNLFVNNSNSINYVVSLDNYFINAAPRNFLALMGCGIKLTYLIGHKEKICRCTYY